MKLDLEDLKAKAKAATPGPWVQGSVSGRCHLNHQHNRGDCKYEHTISPSTNEVVTSDLESVLYTTSEYGAIRPCDSAFIAAANPQVVLEMIDMLEMLANVSDLAIEVCEQAVSKDVEINPSTLLSAIGSVVFELNERTKKYKAKK